MAEADPSGRDELAVVLDGGEQSDPFVMQAWNALKRDPTTAFHSFEDVDGRASLRYATADLMRESCIDCHNSHADTPRSDWKVGDLRGVLEVILPVDHAAAQSIAGLWQVFFIVALPTVVFLALVIWRARSGGSRRRWTALAGGGKRSVTTTR